MAAVETAGLPRTFFDIRDMANGYANNGYPYTPAVGLLNGLNESCKMLSLRRSRTMSSPAITASRKAFALLFAPGGWSFVRHSDDLYSDTVSAISDP